MSTEFVKQTMRENLSRVLVPHIADGLWSIYENAKSACVRNQQPEKTLQTFQNLLTAIPKWPAETLKKEVERIAAASKCDYMEDLLLGVFVSYIRAFASLQQSDATHVDLQFDRPSLEVFVHTFYSTAARKCWSQAFLFNMIGVAATQQARNRRDIEVLLESVMNEVIDSFIPWRAISRAYFQGASPSTSASAASAPGIETVTPVTAAPPVKFAATNEVQEFETDDEDSDEEREPLQVGEDITLSEDEEEVDVVSKASGTVALNL